MKKQVFNPYLPSWEYVPDGEPYVFGDRVYVYGSHDAFGVPFFCVNDYVCWSAPIDDLSNWKYEGIIYRKKQDPSNKLGIHLLFAPDVTKGPDGRFYLYYGIDFLGEIGVAVCNTPAGAYEYYGTIRFKDGHVWGRKSGEEFPFDPAVFVDDDGKVYLYSGFATKVPFVATRGRNLLNSGGVVLELEADMITIKEGPELLFPRKGREGAFENRAFFEASSIRKVKDKYYFVYSTEHNHDLCYATANHPKGPFTFEGRLVDLGDLGIDGKENELQAKNYLGNTHGGLLELNGQWYIFYHRHTNRSSYARQACAELLELTEDGKFKQAEITSCGLNGGPLKGIGSYEARIACNLWAKEGTGRYDCKFPKVKYRKHPYFTQKGKDREDNANQYIANMRDGAVAGFKYFDMGEANHIQIQVQGNGCGEIQVSEFLDFREIQGRIKIESDMNKKAIKSFAGKLNMAKGKKALYFKFIGIGKLDFISFELKNNC
ncbi:MAG: family 43 glycosylhydrolase [Lachnospiraceae bacterium]